MSAVSRASAAVSEVAQRSNTKELLELLHTDVYGPFKHEGHYTTVYLSANDSKLPRKISKFVNLVKN